MIYCFFSKEYLLRYFYGVVIVLMTNADCCGQSFSEVAASNGITTGCGDCSIGSGVSFVDFNEDGLDDLTFATEDGENILFYENNGGGFTLITAPITNTDHNEQVLWVDFDNDGDRDLFVTNFEAPNRLYENDGFFNFTDITVAAGLPLYNDQTYGAVFGDYNNDGWLDLYIANWSFPNQFSNYLFKSDQDGTFTDVTTISGTADPCDHPSIDHNLTFCSTFFDYNNDGYQDLYNSHDRGYLFPSGNSMFKNNGDETFSDVSVASNSGISIDAMTVTVGDYDNDGDLDIYVTNTAPPPPDHLPSSRGNYLLRNNGDESFTDVAINLGVAFYTLSWGANFFDCENDLDLDLYVSSQWVGADSASTLFLNDIDNDTLIAGIVTGMEGDTLNSFSNAIGDFNDDGLPDIVVNNAFDPGFSPAEDRFHLWENTSTMGNNWIKVDLEGVQSNKEGVGSWIEVYLDGSKYVRYRQCGNGYLAQNSTTELIGLGQHIVVDSLKVRWLSGIVDVLYDVDADQKILVVEGSTSEKIKLEAKVFLEGPYDDGLGLMKDSLRTANYLPISEPFASLGFVHVNGGGESVDVGIFDITGNNAIVDWVFLELRDKNDNTSVIDTRSALVQRDGDIVDMDGISPVEFLLAADDYYVAIRHRNHLGVMGNIVVALSTTSVTMDFSDGSVTTYGSDAQNEINGTMCLWTGNVIVDDRVKYTGLNNDRDPILTAIGGVVPTASISGYHSEDVTLDGVVKYTGLENDRDIILVNIGGSVPTATRVEQLP